jgi:hypothetical protein
MRVSKTLAADHLLPLSLPPGRVAGQSPCGGGGEVLIGSGLFVELGLLQDSGRGCVL